ncbi:DsbA family protein [Arthrobacter crusticola]|uniref:DsbA family oxidoreductase n=1 Tax=Arthrobacter crusticola TaxID=2547960 RepID=UPI0014052FE4
MLTNTSRVHQLIHYSKAHGKQLEAEEAVFAAYFTHGRNASDLEQLGQIAEGIGLDRDDAVRALQAEEHLEAVRNYLILNGLPRKKNGRPGLRFRCSSCAQLR